MESMLEDLKHHFCSNVLRVADELQSIDEATTSASSALTVVDREEWKIDHAGESILNCI